MIKSAQAQFWNFSYSTTVQNSPEKQFNLWKNLYRTATQLSRLNQWKRPLGCVESTQEGNWDISFKTEMSRTSRKQECRRGPKGCRIILVKRLCHVWMQWTGKWCVKVPGDEGALNWRAGGREDYKSLCTLCCNEREVWLACRNFPAVTTALKSDDTFGDCWLNAGNRSWMQSWKYLTTLSRTVLVPRPKLARLIKSTDPLQLVSVRNSCPMRKGRRHNHGYVAN